MIWHVERQGGNLAARECTVRSKPWQDPAVILAPTLESLEALGVREMTFAPQYLCEFCTGLEPYVVVSMHEEPKDGT
jgi:hypothetical protein